MHAMAHTPTLRPALARHPSPSRWWQRLVCAILLSALAALLYNNLSIKRC